MAEAAKKPTGVKADSFFGQVREEGRRVTWPTREKAKQNVVVVLAVTAILALFIGFIDVILSSIMGLFFGAGA